MSLYLKWTRAGRVPSYQGGEPIPVDAWTATVKNPALCRRGWHACRWDDAIHHISDELWVCELDGRIVEGNDKVAASRLRLVERVTTIDERALRLFAADCQATGDELADAGAVAEAARAAAWAAAWAAAGDARDAAGAAWAAAGAAAGAAVFLAAGAVAEAAWDAAWDAARAWQTDRLLCHYGGLDPDLFARKAES